MDRRWARGSSCLEADDDGDSGRLSRFSDGASPAAGLSDGFPISGISDARRPSKDMKETWLPLQLVVWQEGLQHARLCDKSVAHPPLSRKGGCLWTRLGYERINAEGRRVCKR